MPGGKIFSSKLPSVSACVNNIGRDEDRAFMEGCTLQKSARHQPCRMFSIWIGHTDIDSRSNAGAAAERLKTLCESDPSWEIPPWLFRGNHQKIGTNALLPGRRCITGESGRASAGIGIGKKHDPRRLGSQDQNPRPDFKTFPRKRKTRCAGRRCVADRLARRGSLAPTATSPGQRMMTSFELHEIPAVISKGQMRRDRIDLPASLACRGDFSARFPRP